MRLLDISRDEAIEIIKDDEAIDKGEKLFELTPEQKKVEKKMKNTGVKTTVDAYGKKRTRTIKQDTDKLNIISEIANLLTSKSNNLEITNPQREINFIFNNRKFKIVLSAPREKKTGT